MLARIASRYSDLLRNLRSGDHVCARLRLPAPVQNGPEPHQASCEMCIWSFQGIKLPGRGTGYPPPCSAGVADALELYHLLPFVPVYAYHGVTFNFTG